MNSNGKCSICGGCLDAVILEIRDPDRFEKAAGIDRDHCNRAWVQCSDCSALSNLRRDGCEADLANIAATYYEIDFAGRSLLERFQKIMELPALQSDNRQRVQRVRRFADQWLACVYPYKEKHVVDIGAGLGVFLTAFLAAEPHWTGTAVEPDSCASEHLREICDIGHFEVVEQRLEYFQPPSPFSCQLVTLNKVLEHIDQPLSFVRQAANLLDPNCGLLYVEVPDRLTVKNRPATDNILGALHCHLYGLRSLTVLLNRSDLIPLCVERILEPSGKISVFGFAAHRQAVERYVNRVPLNA